MFNIYQLSETWIIRNLDDKIVTYIKRRLHFHQGANLSHLKLSASKFGLGSQLISDVYRYCKLSLRQILQKSINQEIQALFHVTKYIYIPIDSIITNNEGKPKSILLNQMESNNQKL